MLTLEPRGMNAFCVCLFYFILFSVEKKVKLKIKYGYWIVSLLYTEDGYTKLNSFTVG